MAHTRVILSLLLYGVAHQNLILNPQLVNMLQKRAVMIPCRYSPSMKYVLLDSLQLLEVRTSLHYSYDNILEYT